MIYIKQITFVECIYIFWIEYFLISYILIKQSMRKSYIMVDIEFQSVKLLW